MIEYESYDTCFETALASFEANARWNVNVQNLLARVTPAEAEAVKVGQVELMNRMNRATDGPYMGPMDYAVITAVRAGDVVAA
jgi:hypothetical protein